MQRMWPLANAQCHSRVLSLTLAQIQDPIHRRSPVKISACSPPMHHIDSIMFLVSSKIDACKTYEASYEAWPESGSARSARMAAVITGVVTSHNVVQQMRILI